MSASEKTILTIPISGNDTPLCEEACEPPEKSSDEGITEWTEPNTSKGASLTDNKTVREATAFWMDIPTSDANDDAEENTEVVSDLFHICTLTHEDDKDNTTGAPYPKNPPKELKNMFTE